MVVLKYTESRMNTDFSFSRTANKTSFLLNFIHFNEIKDVL